MSTTTPSSPGNLPGSPPESWDPLVRLARLAGRPVERFLHIEAASGVLLLVSAAVALAWANSAWAEDYVALWQTPLGIRIGSVAFERTLHWFVNDGLMVIFFFVVGMEIRREIYRGELSEWRRAALPAAAALGGILAPAALYLVIAGAPATRSGWSVPMATDIAFAVGVLTLLGKRVPAALRVLLLAVAVIDDLGAIIVIAIFYTAGVAGSPLLIAGLGFAGVVAMQRFGVRSKILYVVPAVVAWGGIYGSGIHPTIAGVIIGLLTPVRAWFGPEGFIAGVRQDIDHLASATEGQLSTHELSGALRRVGVARREALSPAESLIEMLHPWVAFGIMPIFALANAGVAITGGSLDPESWSVVTAVALGLMLGKPIGVLSATWLTLRLGIGTLPVGVNARHLLVLGLVAGIGFTMALFIGQLAFVDTRLLDAAKLGVLSASGGAGVIGLTLGRLLLAPVATDGAAATADEAEAATES